MNKILTILLFFFLTTSTISAQGTGMDSYVWDTDNIYYASPTSSQAPGVSYFNSYKPVDVDLYTGNPNVSVPIYEITFPDITIPIKLGYNINMVKPNIHPGPTGLGWSLSAGGNITRIQKGFFDEHSNSRLNYGYLGNEKRLSNNWESEYSQYPQAIKSKSWSSLDRMYEQARDVYMRNGNDVAPDEFRFNFLGYSGSFYRDHTGQWKVVSDVNFKVSHSLTTYSNTRSQISDNLGSALETDVKKVALETKTILKFTLTAPDGSTFVFGGINAIDYSINYSHQSVINLGNGTTSYDIPYPVATTWHLVQIITPKGRKINYSYDVLDPIINGELSFFIQSNFGSWAILGRGLNFQLIMPVYLKKIFSGDVAVQFYYDKTTELEYKKKYFQNWEKAFHRVDLTKQDLRYIKNFNEIKWNQLSRIVISHGSDNGLKYDFTYTENSNERLKLKRITQASSSWSGSSIELYNFDYYDDIKLPGYLSGHYDHSGFYNGKDFSFLEDEDFYRGTNIEENQKIYYQAREADTSGKYTQAEMLKKMTFQTGGYSIFHYEPNLATGMIAVNRQQLYNPIRQVYPGGVRIKKIINYSSNNTFLNSKAYYYQYPEKHFNPSISGSTGIMSFANPYYAWQGGAYPLFCCNPNAIDYYKVDFFMSSTTMNQYYNGNGSYVGYTSVIEANENKNGDRSGYTSYQFTNFTHDIWGESHFDLPPIQGLSNFPNNINSTPLSPNDPFISKERERGKPLWIRIYDENNKMKEETYYKYKKTSGNGEIRGIDIFITSSPRLGSTSVFALGGAYSIPTYKYLLSEKRVKKYFNDDDNLTEWKIEYEYNNLDLISSEKYTDNNNTIEKKITYSGDASLALSTINKPMQSANYLGYPIETSVYRNGNVISSEINQYKKLTSSMGGESIFAIDTIFQLENKNPLSDYQKLKVENGKYILDSRCKVQKYFPDYDIYGNPTYVINKDYSNTVILWSYDGTYPVAEIQNSTYEEVGQQLPGMNLGMSQQKLMRNYLDMFDLHKNLPDAQVTTYTYKPLIGIFKTTNPRGVNTHYRYDEFGRLESIINNNSQYLQKHEYNQILDFQKVIIITESECRQFRESHFDVQVNEGSGRYSYKWTIKDDQGNTLMTSNNRTFSMTFTKLGEMRVECEIKDSQKNETSRAVKTITVIPPPPLYASEITCDTEELRLNGKKVSFHVSAFEGSRKYTWNWTIKTPSKTVILPDAYSIIFEEHGDLKVTCTVYDTGTKESVTKEFNSYIQYPLPLQLKEITSTAPPGLTRHVRYGITIADGSGSGNFSYAWQVKTPTRTITNFEDKPTMGHIFTEEGMCVVLILVDCLNVKSYYRLSI